MKLPKNINKNLRMYNLKQCLKKFVQALLKYTILLPFYIYYLVKDRNKHKIDKIVYRHIIKNKDKYKRKSLSEMIKHINKDIPHIYKQNTRMNRDFLYTIFLERYQDTSADFHIKDFLSYSNYRGKSNKKSKRYYNACYYFKKELEHDWFMDELEQYFSKDFQVKRDIYDSWYEKSEYLDLTLA